MQPLIPITAAGFARLTEELKKLKTQDRPNVIEAIAEARGHGDLSENAEYHAARERQAFLESRIATVEKTLASADVIDISAYGDISSIRFGAFVDLVNLDTDEKVTYQIVGEPEADIDSGMLSIIAPLARALINKSSGDTVDVNTPSGEKSYEVTGVTYTKPSDKVLGQASR